MALNKSIINEQGFEYLYHKIDRVLAMFLKDIMIPDPEKPDDPMAMIPSGEKEMQISIRMESFKDQQARLDGLPGWKRNFSFDVPADSNTSWPDIYNFIKVKIADFENATDVLEDGQS